MFFHIYLIKFCTDYFLYFGTVETVPYGDGRNADSNSPNAAAFRNYSLFISEATSLFIIFSLPPSAARPPPPSGGGNKVLPLRLRFTQSAPLAWEPIISGRQIVAPTDNAIMELYSERQRPIIIHYSSAKRFIIH